MLLPVVLFILLISLLSLLIPKEPIKALVQQAGIFAPLVFTLLNLSTFIIAPLSGTPMMAVGYYLFGSQVIIYGFLANILASIINFWISRLWGINLVSKLVGKNNMQKLNDFANQYGLIALFISRFFLRGFVDIISYAAGLTSIKFTPYIIISILADIPGVILLYYLSSLTNNVAQFTLIIVGSSCILLMIYSWLNKQKIKASRK